MAFTPREPQNYSVLDAPRKSSNNINNESTTLEIRKDIGNREKLIFVLTVFRLWQQFGIISSRHYSISFAVGKKAARQRDNDNEMNA